jgi:hypothetical protein
MDSFEWMELQTLASEITNARSRLGEARSRKDNRLVRALESAITAAEQRRARLVAHLTTHLAGQQPAAPDRDEAGPAATAATLPEKPVSDTAPEPPPDDPAEPIAAAAAAATASAPEADAAEGETAVWEQLTPNDLERAKSELAARRREMLARHAEELKPLDADQAELDTLERAIEAFARKFRMPNAERGVVQLGEHRDSRLQASV